MTKVEMDEVAKATRAGSRAKSKVPPNKMLAKLRVARPESKPVRPGGRPSLTCPGVRVCSILRTKGQETIPKAIRDHLHLTPGDRINFFVHPDGSVVILPKLRVSVLKGMVQSRRRHVSINDMGAAAAEGAVGRVQRAKNR